MDRLYTYKQFKNLKISLNYSGVIPKLFLRSTHYPLNQLPSKLMDIYIQSLIDNPEYIMCYFDYDDHIDFIKNNFNYDNKFLNAYNTVISNAYKCDVWRLLALYIYGGIYNDAGHIYTVSINKFLNNTDEFILVEEHEINIGIHNSFIITKPENPIILYILNYIIDNRIKPYNIGCSHLDVTGPIITGTALKSYYNNHLDNSKLNNYRPCSPNSRMKKREHIRFNIGIGNHIINNIKLRVVKLNHLNNHPCYYDTITDENDNIIIKPKFNGYYNLMYDDTVKLHYFKMWEKGIVYNMI